MTSPDSQPALAHFKDVTRHIPGEVRALGGCQEQVPWYLQLWRWLVLALLGSLFRMLSQSTRTFYLALTNEHLVSLALSDGEVDSIKTFALASISDVRVQKGAAMHVVDLSHEGKPHRFHLFHGFVCHADGSYPTDPAVRQAMVRMAEQILQALEHGAGNASR